MLPNIAIVATLLALWATPAHGFSSTVPFTLSGRAQTRTNLLSRQAALFFLDGLRDRALNINISSSSSTKAKSDTSKLGNLKVPNVGIGTISWSSTSRKFVCRTCVQKERAAFPRDEESSGTVEFHSYMSSLHSVVSLSTKTNSTRVGESRTSVLG